MIEVDTLAQAIDESQQEYEPGPGMKAISSKVSAASKALVDIAISLRQIADRPLPATTPRQEQIARFVGQGITEAEEIPVQAWHADWDYISEIMRKVLSDGLSDPDPSQVRTSPENTLTGPKKSKQQQTRRKHEQRQHHDLG